MLICGKDAKPTDPAGYMQLAGYYNRQGEFDKTIEALEQRADLEPNNPEALLHDRDVLLGQRPAQRGAEGTPRRWTTSRRGSRPSTRPADQAGLHRSAGLQGPAAPPQANLETNPARQQALIKEADALATRRKNSGRGRQPARN